MFYIALSNNYFYTYIEILVHKIHLKSNMSTSLYHVNFLMDKNINVYIRQSTVFFFFIIADFCQCTVHLCLDGETSLKISS